MDIAMRHTIKLIENKLLLLSGNSYAIISHLYRNPVFAV